MRVALIDVDGPMCKRCGYSFCVHCDPDGYDREPCVIEEYRCPTCSNHVDKTDKHCRYCGQRLKWEEKLCEKYYSVRSG